MGSPIRVLHVVVNLNRGGAETLLMNLYRHSDHEKVQFDFLTCKPGYFDQEIEKMGGMIHRIPYVTEVGHFHFVKSLRYFFDHHPEYKIVHSHLDKMSGLVLREAKTAGVPIRIAHSHNTSSEGNLLVKGYKWFSGQFIEKNATHLFACSNKASQWLFGKSKRKAIVLKNGINLNDFSFSKETRTEVRRELNFGEYQFVIGHIGRFNKQKNHTFIIDIFFEFLKRNPHSILVLVGDGSMKDEVEKKVSQLGIQHSVRFLGVRGDVHQIIQAFDVFLFPSLHEGFPVTLVEAQTSGLPCVISDVITNEIDLELNLIQMISLKSPPEIWAKAIKEKKRSNLNTVNSLQNSGFNVAETATWLASFYFEVVDAKVELKQKII
jgi:glycosyltransferase involved in cell wall biosynthesis